jgi:hypothetical protein
MNYGTNVLQGAFQKSRSINAGVFVIFQAYSVLITEYK